MAEMRRVLRPGGTALLIDMRRDVSVDEIRRYVNGLGVSRLNRWFMMFSFRGMLIKRAYPLEEIRRMAVEAGWADARIEACADGFFRVDDEVMRSPFAGGPAEKKSRTSSLSAGPFYRLLIRRLSQLPSVVQPPSTASVCPFTKPLFSGSARNAMARATSSGVAKRPIGFRLVMSASE